MDVDHARERARPCAGVRATCGCGCVRVRGGPVHPVHWSTLRNPLMRSDFSARTWTSLAGWTSGPHHPCPCCAIS